MTNNTILERNVLASLETAEAQAAFLWACDKDRTRFKYAAEAFAREVDALQPKHQSLVDIAAENLERRSGLQLGQGDRGDLHRFVMKRHAAHRFPGSKTAWTDTRALEARYER